MADLPPPEGYVAYPREQGSGTFVPGPCRARVEAISDAYDVVKRDWGTWVAIALAIFLVQIIVGIPAGAYSIARTDLTKGPTFDQPIDIAIVSAIVACAARFANGMLVTGVILVGVRRIRGEPTTFGDFFDYKGRAGQLALAELLLCFMGLIPFAFGLGAKALFLQQRGPTADAFTGLWINSAGQLAGEVLAAFLMAWTLFVPLLVVDQGKPVGEAFREGMSVAGPRVFGIFGVLLLAGLLAILGCCAVVVGMLFTFPIYYVTMSVIYHDFYRPKPAESGPAAPTYSVPPITPDALT